MIGGTNRLGKKGGKGAIRVIKQLSHPSGPEILALAPPFTKRLLARLSTSL